MLPYVMYLKVELAENVGLHLIQIYHTRVSLTRLNILNFSSDAEASAKYAPKSSRRWKGGKALHIRCTLHFLKELFLASHICYNLLQRVI